MLMEHLGFDVRIVRGDYYNIKITTPEDLWFAESILQHMRKMGDRT
jgi:2-C-methyl-D-erythritol 4-phosphate cytidylyltransferase